MILNYGKIVCENKVHIAAVATETAVYLRVVSKPSYHEPCGRKRSARSRCAAKHAKLSDGLQGSVRTAAQVARLPISTTMRILLCTPFIPRATTATGRGARRPRVILIARDEN